MQRFFRYHLQIKITKAILFDRPTWQVTSLYLQHYNNCYKKLAYLNHSRHVQVHQQYILHFVHLPYLYKDHHETYLFLQKVERIYVEWDFII